MVPAPARCGLALVATLGFVACLISQADAADHWARFRGPNGTGLSDGPRMPVTWGEADYAWTAPLPGVGHGSPVVWGGKVYVAAGTPEGDQRSLVAVDLATGAELWRDTQPGRPYPIHATNSYASSTPAVDAQRVYHTWVTPEAVYLAAFSHDGQELWRSEQAPFTSQHGYASSPIVVDDTVVLTHDNMQDSYVVALDATTGDQRWRIERPSGKAAYSTPCVTELGGRQAVVLQSMDAGLAVVDLKTGEPLWSDASHFPTRTVSSPFFAGDLLLTASGDGGNGTLFAAMRLEGDRLTEAYRMTRGVPYVPTPIVVGDLLFLWHDGGSVACLDLQSGAELWRQRVGGVFYGSPVAVGGAIYATSVEGEVVVIAADREYRLLGRNPLGGPSSATPAIAAGRILFRSEKALRCLVAGGSTASRPGATGPVK